MTSGALAGLSGEELREAVRAVLREVLPAGVASPAASPDQAAPAAGEVVIATDADLTAFLRRVAALCEDPHVRGELQAGRHGFRLRSPSLVEEVAQQPSRNPPSGAAVRVERGAVTERVVIRASADGARLVLGRGAVLTPLARDKARSLGVEIEKER